VVTLALQVAVGNWARELDARIRAQSSAGVPAPPKGGAAMKKATLVSLVLMIPVLSGGARLMRSTGP
jgi:hypothetical protein